MPRKWSPVERADLCPLPNAATVPRWCCCTTVEIQSTARRVSAFSPPTGPIIDKLIERALSTAGLESPQPSEILLASFLQVSLSIVLFLLLEFNDAADSLSFFWCGWVGRGPLLITTSSQSLNTTHTIAIQHPLGCLAALPACCPG